jgi:hypothetical protein
MKNKNETLEEYKARFDKGLADVIKGEVRQGYTPGPWRVTRKGMGTGLNYTSFAIYPVASNTPIDITAENAALLASAPELLNILDDALAALHHENECIIMMGKEPRYIELVTKGLQVIKKAKGEE